MFHVKHNWKNLGSKICSFQKEQKFTDIELVVENQVFNGHKLILASASPYFECMFSTELSEKDKTRIELHGFKKKLFQVLFDYIYKRNLEINDDNIEEILEGSNILQLTGLTTSCCKFLKKKINEKNVISIYRLMDAYSSTESQLSLKRKCKFFIEQNFLKMIKNEDFLDLPFHLLEILLKSESLNIHNELDVFKATVNWILKEPEVRIKHVYVLIKHVRLPIIPEQKKEQLIEKIGNDELKSILKKIIKQDLKKDQQIENGEKTNLTNEFLNNNEEEFKNLVKINLRWKSRIMCTCTFYLIGGRNERDILSDIIRIDPFNFKFTHLNRLNVTRYSHQSVEMNGLLYIAGGINTQTHLKLVETFDYYENEKVNSSFMVNCRQDFGLVNFNNNYLLAIGGSPINPNSVEKYNPQTNQWSIFETITDLPVKGFRVVKVLNEIYIIGGINRFNQELDQTLSYNPETGVVRKLSKMRECRSSFGCTYAFGYIYVVGGTTKKTAERYSLVNDEWTFISGLDRAVENCCVTVAFNKLLLIGGEDPLTKSSSNKINCYDPENNQWAAFKDLPFRISSASLVKI